LHEQGNRTSFGVEIPIRTRAAGAAAPGPPGLGAEFQRREDERRLPDCLDIRRLKQGGLMKRRLPVAAFGEHPIRDDTVEMDMLD